MMSNVNLFIFLFTNLSEWRATTLIASLVVNYNLELDD